MTTNKILFKDLDILHICKPSLKHSYISVNRNSQIVVKTAKVSNRYIFNLLNEKESWIRKQLFNASNRIDISKKIEKEEEARRYLTSRLQYFSKIMDLKYREIKFKKLKSRWGSCSSRSVITINLYLYNLPKNLVDYVLVHELSHLIHMNHSRKFHTLVEKYIPDAKQNREELKNINLV